MSEPDMAPARLIICMGVSGCGKSTMARAIAEAFGVVFLEADDFHGPENRAWMAAGRPLSDAMRAPWIERIVAALKTEAARGRDCVLACSALRQAHRERLRAAGLATRFLFLDGDRERLAAWMRARDGHFMPASLLDSQFDTLERPDGEPDVTRILLSADWASPLKLGLEAARRFLDEDRSAPVG
jgi:gluconokinase